MGHSNVSHVLCGQACVCSLCDVLQGNGGGPSGLQEDPDSEFVTRVWVWVWVHGYSKPLILSILFGCRSRLGGGG